MWRRDHDVYLLDSRGRSVKQMYAAVGSLPCQRCESLGQQQRTRTTVAHSNQLRDGKGRGLKSHWWRVAALCEACHAEIDQGSKLSKTERREQWDEAHRLTIGALFEQGLIEVKEVA